MTTIDLHDTVSVLIPGACALCIIGVFGCNIDAATIEMLSNLSVASSLLFLAAAYVVGELLQALGKWAAKTLINPHNGGDPYLWILRSCEPRSFYADFLTRDACRQVQALLKKEFGFKKLGEDELNSCFYHIKMTAYSVDAYRTECIKMLSKLHLFSSLLILCVLTPIAYVIMAIFSSPCEVANYCYVHDSFSFKSAAHFSWHGFFVILFASFFCGRIIFLCFLQFNKSYNRCLYTSYLAVKVGGKKPLS